MKTKRLILSEETLIRTINERHPNGALALYNMYSASLFGVISRIVPDTIAAEDILQEVFIKIWHSFAQYDTAKGRLFTWMVNIARNQAIDCVRSKNYRKQQYTQNLDGLDILITIPESDYDRCDAYIVRRDIARLRPEENSIIQLIYYQGFTHVEVAKELGIPLGTVKTRLQMALKRLRNYYNGGELAFAS